MKLSDAVVNFLSKNGIKHVFLVPGGGAMHLNESVRACQSLVGICNLHEQASAVACESYGRVSKKFGVALVTSGPGGTNAVTGVLCAWQDSTPCLFISGQVKRADLAGSSGLRQKGVQEVNIVEIVSSITKYAVTIPDPSSIRFHLEKALFLAKSGRPGPCWIDIPLDVQAAQIDWDTLESFDEGSESRTLSPQKLELGNLINSLKNSERPLILIGNGVRLANAEKMLLTLLERINAPVCSTWPALDIVDNGHPLYIGRPGGIAPRGANFAIQNCDLLITIGARLDLPTTGYNYQNFARGAAKFLVDIDGAELAKFGPDFATTFQVDAAKFIEAFEEALQVQMLPSWSAWMDCCRNWNSKYKLNSEKLPGKDGIASIQFSEILSTALSEEQIVVTTSAGAAIELFYLAFRAKRGQRVIHNRGTGAMGLALPASIGACLASDRKVICIDGDGGFQFNIQELQTIRTLNLPIIIFVLNNSGYASIRTSQKRYFGKMLGADSDSGLFLPQIADISTAYGIASIRVATVEDLCEKIEWILRQAGPLVIDVAIDREEVRAPCIATRQLENGSMISSPLEDLWPFLDRQEFIENMIIPPLPESLKH